MPAGLAIEPGDSDARLVADPRRVVPDIGLAYFGHSDLRVDQGVDLARQVFDELMNQVEPFLRIELRPLFGRTVVHRRVVDVARVAGGARSEDQAEPVIWVEDGGGGAGRPVVLAAGDGGRVGRVLLQLD